MIVRIGTKETTEEWMSRDCIFAVEKVMFSTAELIFNTAELKFNTAEHRFSIAERRFLLMIKTIILKSIGEMHLRMQTISSRTTVSLYK